MKMLVQKQWSRIAVLSFAISLGVITVRAQHATGDITKQAAVQYGTSTTGSIKVIDNKGTIKYLQVQNGLTMITNTDAAKGITTTTWQLGGALTDDTYIDVNGKTFGLDKLSLVDAGTLSASTDATDKSSHSDATPGTGFTLLVRNEATGAVMKLKASDLVVAGQQKFTAVAGTTVQNFVVTTPDSKLPVVSKISVYRNGIKLIAGDDYAIDGTTLNQINITPKAAATDDTQWQFYAGDVIEVHWFK